MKKTLPTPTINRIFIYLKVLNDFLNNNIDFITSKELEKITGCESTQIRKDFSFIGKLGKKKKGYHIKSIIDYFSEAFKISRPINVGIIGIGNLGRALISYKGFEERGFKIVAGFDIDTDKIGWEINNVKIFNIKDIKKVAFKKKIDIVIITTPKSEVNSIINVIKKTNIKGVLNFASKYIPLDKKVFIKNIDISLELEHMLYNLINNYNLKR
jgi:redox-sensing transcriptional repressor